MSSGYGPMVCASSPAWGCFCPLPSSWAFRSPPAWPCSRLGKGHFFLWAWGINGLFSVVGSVAVPLVAVLFGLKALMWVAACAYLLALPAFFALLLPRAGNPSIDAGL